MSVASFSALARKLSDSAQESADPNIDTVRLAHDPEALLELARKSGMLVLLDAQIGQQRYHSVAGSIVSLTRFARAICESVEREFATGALGTPS